jgi:tRNA(Arg) A34 adenosine deaminase TadA
MVTTNHEFHIRESIQVAREAAQSSNPPFGALVRYKDEILLKAGNTQVSDNDITCHAEFNLIKQAVQSVDPEILAKSTVYTSNEPCPMCAGAIYWSGIRRVIFGCSMETIIRIRGDGWLLACRNIFATTPEPVEVIGPVLEEEVVPVLKDYYSAD